MAGVANHSLLFWQVHFLPYGAPEPSWLMGSTHDDLHERPVPGFLCFRTWDITRKKLVRNVIGQRPNDFIDADDRAMAHEVGTTRAILIKAELREDCTHTSVVSRQAAEYSSQVRNG